jgi:phospholipid/cholesterol/gamma-HCH transport system substrate-binding protein
VNVGNTKLRDMIVGLFVLLGLGAIAYLSFSIGGAGYSGDGMTIYAVFDQVADLKTRAPVQIAGVKVGQVMSVELDDTYRAKVTMTVNADLELPVDSSAGVMTSGLLGDRYVQIELGAEDAILVDGDQVGYTESAMLLERVIGKALYNFNNKDD